MKLSKSHRHELWSIGMRGLATLIGVLLFWGTTAPMIFFPHSHDHDNIITTSNNNNATFLLEQQQQQNKHIIYKLSSFSGVSSTIVLIGCFVSSYTNLLTPNLSKEEKRYGFTAFWFVGSLFFNLVWQLPYWSIPIMHPHLTDTTTVVGLYWKIIWWSYTLYDEWYYHLTKLVIAFEIWWLLGNVVGGFGLYYFYKYHYYYFDSDTKEQQQQQNSHNNNYYYYRKSLICFAICGSLQCYNATIYLFLSYYLSGLSNVPNHPLSIAIFWGLNGFWAIASGVASYFASSLLLLPMLSSDNNHNDDDKIGTKNNTKQQQQQQHKSKSM